MVTGYSFQEINNETLLKIYEISAQFQDWKEGIDHLLTYCRQFFIFDNVAIYLNEDTTERMDVIYARATGRGRSKEADVSWGETIANRIFSEKKIILEESSTHFQSDRLTAPFVLGIPLNIANGLGAALVFIRFGGPAYEEGSLEIAKLLAVQITSLIRLKCLNDLEKELEKQRTYTALQGDFISTISHEIRNPLGFIRGYTTTLLREDTNWDKKTQHDFLEIIDRETNNLSNLIDDLLDSSRLQSGNMRFDFQTLRIESIVRDEVSRARTNNPGQIIQMNTVKNIPAIMGDPRRLAQVIDNLLDNSNKYAPQTPICINIYPKDTNIYIEYSDGGPGIDEKYLPMVFSRFFRVPENSAKVRGSGLGLSICKKIIESHNGEMTVHSEPGKGLTFIIRLPQQISTIPEP